MGTPELEERDKLIKEKSRLRKKSREIREGWSDLSKMKDKIDNLKTERDTFGNKLRRDHEQYERDCARYQESVGVFEWNWEIKER